MELINRIRKNRKGFTLVEIIVVLVILAILAAFTIPTMLGFVGDAKKKAAIAEQREVYVAAQAIATEHFAKEGATKAETSLGMTAATKSVATNLGSAKAISTATDPVALEMYNYLKDDIKAGDGGTTAATAGPLWTVTVDVTGKVTEVTYKKDGVTLDPLVPSSTLN